MALSLYFLWWWRRFFFLVYILWLLNILWIAHLWIVLIYPLKCLIAVDKKRERGREKKWHTLNYFNLANVVSSIFCFQMYQSQVWENPGQILPIQTLGRASKAFTIGLCIQKSSSAFGFLRCSGFAELNTQLSH